VLAFDFHGNGHAALPAKDALVYTRCEARIGATSSPRSNSCADALERKAAGVLDAAAPPIEAPIRN
jgi:hypothetical protein